MLSTLLSILVLFFILNYFMTVPTGDNEFLMTQEYIGLFGGSNATNTDLRTCMRADLVIIYKDYEYLYKNYQYI
jgi:hypothetical protein